MTAHPLPDGRIPVLLSAHEEDLVAQDAAAILTYLDREPSVAAVAATLLRLRRLRRHRAVVRAADRSELAAGLRALANGEEHPLVARSSEPSARRIAFVFPGQGNQWPAMGAESYRRLPAYRAEADRCAEAFAAAGLPSPLPYLLAEADPVERKWSQIHIQGAQFTHAVSLAQVWRCCGILPDITVGHSLGEIAAAYVAGAVALPDAVTVVAARAATVDRLTGSYGMAVLSARIEEAKQFIAETPGWLEVSAVNAPSSIVVSGDRAAVAAIVRRVAQRGRFARAIAVDYPGHTSALAPLRAMFQELLPRSAFLDAPAEFVSSAYGALVRPGTAFIDYWYDNFRNPVRFDDAVATAVQRGANAFVELSAHPSLLSSLVDLVDDESAVIVGSGRRDQPVTDQLAASVAAVAVADPGYRWADVAGIEGHRPLQGFPNTPMRAIHLWAKPEPLPPSPGSALTVAVEEWQPHAAQSRRTITGKRCGVAIVGPRITDTPLPQRLATALTRAVAAHRGCDLTGPGAAEIVVVIAPDLMHSDAMVAAGEIVRRRDVCLPDYAAVVGSRCRTVWLFTAGGEQVHPDDPPALPAQAVLGAMHRSVGFEFPDQAFAHLDLPFWDIDADAALACVDALLGDPAEIALRCNLFSGSGVPGQRCYARTLRVCRQAPPERALEPAALDNVVITGGSGLIGLRYAQYCVEHGARRVVLLSRKGVDRADLDRRSDGHPVEVHTPACDVTDPDALSKVAAEYAGDGASLLIHAAGAARFGTHDQLTEADLDTACGAKVIGLARMVDRWPLRQDVRILLCSSVSGVWGGYGHAAYAAGNRLLDVFAGQLRAKGLDCTAVRWGLWQGTGIAGAEEIARIERSGLVAMDPNAAVPESLRHHGGDPLILAADFDRLRVFFESQGTPMPFAEAEAPVIPDPATTDGGGCGKRSVAEVVRTELAGALSLGDPASLDLNAALVDLGVDSLLALDLRKRLRRATGRSVPLASLLGGITGVELIDALRPSTEPAGRLESSRD
jgi:mycobactin polyketide synthetase MbtD